MIHTAMHRHFRALAAAALALAVAACGGGSGGGSGGDPTEDGPGSVIVQADVSGLVNSGLDVASLAGQIDCPGGTAVDMTIAGAIASGECADLAAGQASFAIDFTYNHDGATIELATAARDFTVVAGETRTLEFAGTDLTLSDTNGDGISNLDDLLLTLDPGGAGSNAFLSSLVLACADEALSSCNNLTLLDSAGQPTASPGFVAAAAVGGLTDYASVQQAAVEAITVTPAAVGGGATITVGGQTVVSGATSDPIPLAIDGTEIEIVVTAADGVTTVIYQLFVTSLANSDADLVALSLSADELAVELDPAFDREITGYIATVAFPVDNLSVTATTSQPAATIAIEAEPVQTGEPSEPLPLGVGPNPIEIVVTAPDGVTERAYVVTVTRLGSADLATLTLTGLPEDPASDPVGLALVPDFAPSVLVYDSEAENRIIEVIVAVTAAAEGAVIEVNGVDLGASGESAPIALDVGVNELHVDVSHAVSGSATPFEQRYIVTVLRSEPPRYDPEAYLKPPAPAGIGPNFGTVLAMSAAGDLVAVGAPGTPENENNPGAVYIFTLDAGLWSTQTLVLPDAPEALANGARFGHSVALSANGNVLAVGAPARYPGEDVEEDAPAVGQAYVYTRDGAGGWSAPVRIDSLKAIDDDGFGYSVALSGDGLTLAVGAPEDPSGTGGIFHDPLPIPGDVETPGNGAVHVYTLEVGDWVPQAFIKVPEPAPRPTGALRNELFGHSLALSSDGNRLAVGMPGESSEAAGINGEIGDPLAVLDSGAVYVYVREAGVWQAPPVHIKPQVPRVAHLFGSAVALTPDGSSLAVGEPRQGSRAQGIWDTTNEDEIAAGQFVAQQGGGLSGAAYVFRQDGDGGWFQETFFKASNSRSNILFGTGLALTADGETLVVGAPGENSTSTTVDGNQDGTGAAFSGAAYVFVRENGEWEQVSYIKTLNSRSGIRFGSSMAISVTGDRVAGGAPTEDSASEAIVTEPPYPDDAGAVNRGATYLFIEVNPDND